MQVKLTIVNETPHQEVQMYSNGIAWKKRIWKLQNQRASAPTFVQVNFARSRSLNLTSPLSTPKRPNLKRKWLYQMYVHWNILNWI